MDKGQKRRFLRTPGPFGSFGGRSSAGAGAGSPSPVANVLHRKRLIELFSCTTRIESYSMGQRQDGWIQFNEWRAIPVASVQATRPRLQHRRRVGATSSCHSPTEFEIVDARTRSRNEETNRRDRRNQASVSLKLESTSQIRP